MRPSRSTSAISPRRAAPSSRAQIVRIVSAAVSASICTARPPSKRTLQVAHDGAVHQHERLGRGDGAVHARGVGRGEDLLRRQVRHVLEPVDALEARRRPARRRQQPDGQVGARTLVVQRVEAALRSGARRSRRGSPRARARPRPGPPRRGGRRASGGPRAARGHPPSGRSGKTSFAHGSVGQGAIVQFVVRSLTTLPASLSEGKRSRPTRAGSRSSIRPGAVGPDSPTRAAPISPSASRRLPCQSGMKSRSSSRACSTRVRLTHGSKYCTSTNLAPRR